MIGHQRSVLSALGIDLWIPKGEVCQERMPDIIWRDQSKPEMITEIVVSPPIAPPESSSQRIEAARSLPVQPTVLPDLTPAVSTDFSLDEQFQVEAFSLQMLNLTHCIIVTDATQLTLEQQTLWANIQRAGDAVFYELNWPFAWQKMQNGRGAASYTRGFVDVMLMDKHLIVLGQVASLQHEKAIQLASLQEMLDEPLLKKRLWQFMRRPRTDH